MIKPGKFAWMFCQQLRVSQVQVTNKRYVGIGGRCLYVCVLTERDQESSWLRESASLGVKTSVGTQATIIKDKETNGDATCTCRYMRATRCGCEPQSLHKAVLIGVQACSTLAIRLLIPFSQYRSLIACIFLVENILRPTYLDNQFGLSLHIVNMSHRR